MRIEDKSVPALSSKPLEEVEKILGCDLGLTKLVHLSDNAQIDNPRFGVNKKVKRTLKIRQRRVSRKQKGSNRKKKAAIRVGKLHKKIVDKRGAYQWKIANLITSRGVDAIAVEDLNVAGMMKRCKVQKCSSSGCFLKNGQSRKKALNRAIADAGWSELILKIEYLAAKRGKVVIKVDPRHSSQECRKCSHKDKANREKERFICVNCGYMEHADIGAAKTVRDRAYKLIKVPADCGKLGDKTPKRPKKSKETSPRSMSRSFANAQDGEPGNRNTRKG